MSKIYIDPVSFHCHPTQNADGTRIEYETAFFDGKCDTFIEGFRCVPGEYSWTRSDGIVFDGGEMITAWKPYSELEAAQAQYERDQAELLAAYQEGVDSVCLIL